MLEQIEKFREEYERDVLALADELRGQQLPVLTNELFSEFERNGNRLRYEAAYFGRRKFLSVFGAACAAKRRKRDLEKLEEILSEICGEECWALPAHVNREKDPDWRRTVDLFASETAQTLAQLITLFQDELSADVRKRVRKEIQDRVLRPFMESEPPYSGWERSGNNWNAVCCGNIGSAALFLLEEGRERRDLMERLFHALTRFYLAGFGEDGACEEGLGYWTYGITYYTLFAEQLKEAFPDMDLMAEKKMKAIACFQQKCCFEGGRTLSFSDGNSHESFSLGLACQLAYHFDEVRFPDIACAQRLGQDPCWRWAGIYWNLHWTEEYMNAVREGRIGEPKQLSAFGDEVFPDAQWAVFRGAAGSAVAVKGGHNAESHNHNDVGSFLYLADGEVFLEDLGCGEYTKDYFSDKRYTIFCNRGESHNIPIIGGSDQCPGREYRADDFAVPEKGTARIRFEAAYGQKNLKRLERRLHLEAATGGLEVEDVAVTEGETGVLENLVTKLPVTVEDGRIRIRGGRYTLIVTPLGISGEIGRREVLHSNHQGQTERVSVLRWSVEPGRKESDRLYRGGFRADLTLS